MTTQKRRAGERLKALREARSLTKTALGEAAMCSRFAIHLYEQGLRCPNGPISFRLFELTRDWGDPILPTEWTVAAS